MTARRRGQHRREPIGMPTEAQKAAALQASKIEAVMTLFEPRDAPVRMVRLDDIEVAPDRMRALRAKKVDEIAESIARGGLLQPIVIRPRRQRKDSGKSYRLVAGWHRWEAVRQLGHDRIAATILDGLDADAALLAEIDENLIRADLTPAERAAHVGRRKELYEKLHPETKHGAVGRRGKSRQLGEANERFTKDMAKKTGQSERKVQRDVTRANKVVVLPDVVGTSLDQGDELDALAKLPPDEQRKLADQAKSGEEVSAKTPPPGARDDIGPDSASETAIKDVELEDLRNAKRRLEIENIGLRVEIEDLKKIEWHAPRPDDEGWNPELADAPAVQRLMDWNRRRADIRTQELRAEYLERKAEHEQAAQQEKFQRQREDAARRRERGDHDGADFIERWIERQERAP